MKFNELNFKPHSIGIGERAVYEDDNLRVSIVIGDLFYSNGKDTYEIMALRGVENITENPIGYLTKEEVEKQINEWIENE